MLKYFKSNFIRYLKSLKVGKLLNHKMKDEN